MSEFVKLTVNLTKETAEILKSLAKDHGTTMTNVVNRAIELESYLKKQVEGGGEIQIAQQDGKVKAIHLR